MAGFDKFTISGSIININILFKAIENENQRENRMMNESEWLAFVLAPQTCLRQHVKLKQTLEKHKSS